MSAERIKRKGQVGLLPLYEGYAVPPDYDGRFADDFHRMVARNYLNGMIGGHTSATDYSNVEGIARAHLAIDWGKRWGLYASMNRFDSKFCWWKWEHLQDVITGWRCSFMWWASKRWFPCPYTLSEGPHHDR